MQENARKERWYKPFEELTIADDFLFGKVMQEPRICRRLLEIILNIKIREVVILENEKTIKPDYEGRGIRLDIYVEDENQTVYNVEMQTRNEGDLPKRSRYYQSLIDINLLDKGMPIKDLQNTLIIFICTFDLFGMGDYVYTFENRCRQHTELILNDGTAKLFVNTKGSGGTVTEEFASLMNYFNGSKPTDEFTREVDEAVERAKQRLDLSVEYKAWNLMKMNLYQEGKQEGKQEGEKEGEQKGEQKGKQVNMIQLACKKKAKGYSVEETADMLEEEPELIRRIYQIAESLGSDCDEEKIYAALCSDVIKQ